MNRGDLARHLGLILFCLCANAWSQAPEGEEAPSYWVIRAFYSSDEALRQVSRWGEPWEIDRENRFFLMEADENLIVRLLELGMEVEIDDQMTADLHRLLVPLKNQGSGIPGFPCYLRVDETYQFGQDLALNYPNLADWIDIGDSWEKSQGMGAGDDLFVLVLTNKLIAGPKPKLFAMSAMHAREYATAGITTGFAQYLIDQYGVDADATWILDYHEVHLLLQTNPDGRKQAETGLFWRKNTDNDFCSDSNNRGIDLNRNFAAAWGGQGSSDNPSSQVYRGTAPFSEPESAALRALADAERIDAHIDFHSYGQLLLHPWSYKREKSRDHRRLRGLAERMAAAIKAEHNERYRPLAGASLYPAAGTMMDWTYQAHRSASFVIELRPRGGTGFVLPPEQIQPTCDEALAAVLTLGEGLGRTTESATDHPPAVP